MQNPSPAPPSTICSTLHADHGRCPGHLHPESPRREARRGRSDTQGHYGRRQPRRRNGAWARWLQKGTHQQPTISHPRAHHPPYSNPPTTSPEIEPPSAKRNPTKYIASLPLLRHTTRPAAPTTRGKPGPTSCYPGHHHTTHRHPGPPRGRASLPICGAAAADPRMPTRRRAGRGIRPATGRRARLPRAARRP